MTSLILSSFFISIMSIPLIVRGRRTVQIIDEEGNVIPMRMNIYGPEIEDICMTSLIHMLYFNCEMNTVCVLEPNILAYLVQYTQLYMFTTMSSLCIMDQVIPSSGILHLYYRLFMRLLTFALLLGPISVALPILAVCGITCVLAVQHLLICACMPHGRFITPPEKHKFKFFVLTCGFILCAICLMVIRVKYITDDSIQLILLVCIICILTIAGLFYVSSLNVENTATKFISLSETDTRFTIEDTTTKFSDTVQL